MGYKVVVNQKKIGLNCDSQTHATRASPSCLGICKSHTNLNIGL